MHHTDELDMFDARFERIREAENRYIATKPYRVSIKYDAVRREDVIRIQITKATPHALRALVGEALNSLRTALNYLAVAVVEANGVPKLPKRVEFPIFATEELFRRDAIGKRGQVAEASTGAQAAFETLQPYKRSDWDEHPLWALHELAIGHRHRAPLMTGIGLRNIRIAVQAYPVPVTVVFPTDGTYNNGAELARIQFPIQPGERLTRDFKMDVKARAEYAVAFSKTGPGKGRLILDIRDIRDTILNRVFPAMKPFL